RRLRDLLLLLEVLHLAKAHVRLEAGLCFHHCTAVRADEKAGRLEVAKVVPDGGTRYFELRAQLDHRRLAVLLDELEDLQFSLFDEQGSFDRRHGPLSPIPSRSSRAQ